MPDNDSLAKLSINPDRRRARRGRKWLSTALWAIAAIAVIGGVWAYPYIVPQEVQVVPVRVARPEMETSTLVLSVTGYVVPHRRIELAPKIVGRVLAIKADKGDRVKQGQELVLLDESEFRAAVDQAQARLARAEAHLAELKAGTRKEEIEQARSDVDLCVAQMRDAEQTLKRSQALALAKVEAQQALDKAANDFDAAKARTAAAKRRLELAIAGPRVEVISAAEADVQEARANLTFNQTQLRECVIKAPVDGTVLERLVEPGEMVTNTSFGGTRGARSAVMSIANLSDMQVEIDLNQGDLARVYMKQPCTVGLEAYPDKEYRGEVTKIAPEANRQKATVEVKVQVFDPDEFVRPELNARVSFYQPVKAGAGQAPPAPRFFVPASAIVERDGQPVVAVVDGTRARLRQVTRGMETPNGVEITKGLTGSEQVLLNPPERLRDASAIKPKTTTN